MVKTLTLDVNFGDCDPARIVFYPNAFRWMDASFHHLLRDYGGHAELCSTLGALGLGLVDASAQFRRPMRDGDRLNVQVSVAEWTLRSVALAYKGTVGDVTTFAGREVRCLFTRTDAGIVAGDLSQLRALMEQADV